MRSGSSSSAIWSTCSAKSPVSLKKEKSEPASDEARRLPRFSSSASRDSSECSSEARGGAGVRVRSGMLPGAARDDAGVLGGGMVPVERTRADRAALELFREKRWRVVDWSGVLGQGGWNVNRPMGAQRAGRQVVRSRAWLMG